MKNKIQREAGFAFIQWAKSAFFLHFFKNKDKNNERKNKKRSKRLVISVFYFII